MTRPIRPTRSVPDERGPSHSRCVETKLSRWNSESGHATRPRVKVKTLAETATWWNTKSSRVEGACCLAGKLLPTKGHSNCLTRFPLCPQGPALRQAWLTRCSHGLFPLGCHTSQDSSLVAYVQLHFIQFLVPNLFPIRLRHRVGFQ